MPPRLMKVSATVLWMVGVFVFFALVWPNDAHRPLIWTTGADAAFWTPAPLLARLAAEGKTFNA